MADPDRTASLMTPSKLAQIKPKAAASPAAWLSQMAADVGHQHVRRVRELQSKLLAQALQRDASPVAAELARLGQALPRLDFGLLQDRGWWARTTGKSRGSGAEFAAQFEQIDQVTSGLSGQAQSLQKKRQEQSAAADLALVELDVEYHAIDKIIDQGARWLQDMRAQLKSREGAADPAAKEQTRQDTERCEILVARLKVLRAVSSAAQQSQQHAQAAARRQLALLQLLRKGLGDAIKSWRARLSAVAAAAKAGSTAGQNLDDSMEAHRELQLCIKQAVAECGHLQAQEQSLVDSLAALATQLEVA
jgi:hypothetical protein